MAGGEPPELVAADRAGGRGGVGLGLGAAFDGLAEQCLDVVSGLDFEVAEVVVAGLGQALDGLIQGAPAARAASTVLFSGDASLQDVENAGIEYIVVGGTGALTHPALVSAIKDQRCLRRRGGKGLHVAFAGRSDALDAAQAASAGVTEQGSFSICSGPPLLLPRRPGWDSTRR